MVLLKTYTVKIENGDIWQFKYNLNGVLVYFNLLEGELSEKHSDWLYKQGKYPYLEAHIIDWIRKYKQLVIEIGERDLSFLALWNLYGNKVAKFHAEVAFKKLKEPEIIKCFLSVPGYLKYIQKKKIGHAHLATYINGRYYEDDWSKA